MEGKFPKRLKELRKNNELSQGKFASEINMSKTIVSKWENGKAAPSVDAIICMTRILNCSSDYILGLKSEQGIDPRMLEYIDKLKSISYLDREVFYAQLESYLLVKRIVKYSKQVPKEFEDRMLSGSL